MANILPIPPLTAGNLNGWYKSSAATILESPVQTTPYVYGFSSSSTSGYLYYSLTVEESMYDKVAVYAVS